MPAWYEIRFPDGDGDKEWYGSCGFYYEFADGSTIGLYPAIAWCCDCNAFVNAEWLPSLQEIQQDLAELHDSDSMRASIFTSTEPPFDESPYRERRARGYVEAKDEAARRVEWRKNRKTSPKCLNCGSMGVRFPGDDQTVHVPGRGTATIKWSGMCSTAFRNWFYTPEGMRIPRETKPTYWRLREAK